MMTKKIVSVMVVMALAVVPAFPAMAHGHGHGYGHHRQESTVCAAPAETEAQTETGCPVCPVEGCLETGRHVHDGTDYCGYAHSSGYCDGSCVTGTADPAPSVSYGGHHGHHR